MEIMGLACRLRKSNLFGLRPLVNYAYYNPKTVIMPLGTFDYVAVDNFLFKFNDQVGDLQRVLGNPWFAGIRPDDVVLDIGANIGAIAIPLASVAQTVFAVEPLYTDVLKENLELNHLHNVRILKYALGQQHDDNQIIYGLRQGKAELKTFAELRHMCGGKIDFLKCDCEGGEWSIQPQECEGIRELRIEFHIRRKHVREDRYNLEKWRRWFETNDYSSQIYDARTVISFPSVPFKQCWLVRASRNG